MEIAEEYARTVAANAGLMAGTAAAMHKFGYIVEAGARRAKHKIDALKTQDGEKAKRAVTAERLRARRLQRELGARIASRPHRVRYHA